MHQERLLERIGRLEESKGLQPLPAASRQLKSIIYYLDKLLNTRQGSALIASDFGVPDITNISGETVQETRQHLERIIQKVIEKYEPRLSHIKMSMQHDDNNALSLRFRLEANLVDQEEIPVIFETVVSADGKISVNT